MGYSTIDVKPVAGALGAEIEGLSLADLSETQFAEVRQAFLEYSVVFFRDQTLTEEQHIAFALRWGEINVNRFFTPVATHPMIAEVRKEPDQERNIGRYWHADHSYDTVPALGSALYAVEVPEYGGDTLFASMYRAYDALSSGMKKLLEGLNALHSSRHVFGYKHPETAVQDVIHPVVIRHPETGRKALFVNSNFTVQFENWTKEESEPLLEYLYQHGASPEFTCRFRWEKGSMALWDNRSTWHCALNDYQGERRLMHRITIEGVPLSAANGV